MPFEPSTLSRQQTAWQAVKTNLFWVQREVISILPRACESAQNLAELSLCPSKYCYKTLIHPCWSPQYSASASKSPAREGNNLFIYLFVISGQPMKPSLSKIKLHPCLCCIPLAPAWLCKTKAIYRPRALPSQQGVFPTRQPPSTAILHLGTQGLTRPRESLQSGWGSTHYCMLGIVKFYCTHYCMLLL